MATIKDVAALAGISYTTVSHVINGTRPVAPETRARVEEAVRKLGYCQNMVARGLRKGETMTVGVVSVSSSDAYFAEVLHGVEERGGEDGYGVYISYTALTDVCPAACKVTGTDYLGAREAENLSGLERRGIQGLILNSLQADDRLESVLSALRAPCILFQRLVRGPGWDNFICDDYQGASDAMHYLLSLGHRRIGLVEGFGFETHSVKFRKKAWEDALAAAGIGIDPALIRDGRYDPAAAYSETRALLSMTDRPTAILYYSDTMAFAGIRAAADLGLSVPGDLSVVGYDNLPIDDLSVPRLTSVNQMSCQIGRDMMERLIERIASPGLESLVRSYPQDLVVRESTGKPPSR